jgi:hypothetical protein
VQSFFRALNQRILVRSTTPAGSIRFICECTDPHCFEVVKVTREEYEELRGFPTRFLVRSGHWHEDDRVVDSADEVAIVEKIGPGAHTAIRLDPRRTIRRVTRPRL